MDRLNDKAVDWLEQHQYRTAPRKEKEPDAHGAALDVAKAKAKRLAVQLAPLFPVIASLTKSDQGRCEVSRDHIHRRSWALFRARDVMRGVVESFKAEQAA